jgi:hypothetical protein
MTDDAGVFEFPAVRQGDWFLAAGTFMQSVPVSVRADVEDVVIRLEVPFLLAGHVVTADGTAPPTPAVVIQLLPASGETGSIGLSGKAGKLEFQSVTTGLYRLHASAMGNYYIDSLTVGETDARQGPVSLSPASGELRIVIKPGATISGRVEKSPGSTVLVIPQPLTQGSIGKLATAEGDGKFQFTGLGPGDYYVIAVSDFDGWSMLNIERLNEIVQGGATVHLDEGGAASVQLKLR